jgi:hypothetical protein
MPARLCVPINYSSVLVLFRKERMQLRQDQDEYRCRAAGCLLWGAPGAERGREEAVTGREYMTDNSSLSPVCRKSMRRHCNVSVGSIGGLTGMIRDRGGNPYEERRNAINVAVTE